MTTGGRKLLLISYNTIVTVTSTLTYCTGGLDSIPGPSIATSNYNSKLPQKQFAFTLQNEVPCIWAFTLRDVRDTSLKLKVRRLSGSPVPHIPTDGATRASLNDAEQSNLTAYLAVVGHRVAPNSSQGNIVCLRGIYII